MDPTLIAPQLLSLSSSRVEPDASVPEAVKTFYWGEPLALGITQIFIGFMHIAFGVYIISGSLSVAAAGNPKVSMVKGMLGMNVVSSVAAGIVIVFLCFQLDFYRASLDVHHFCNYKYLGNSTECDKILMRPWKAWYGIGAVFLVFSILQFCITISTAVFGCKTVFWNTHTETVVVVCQKVTPGDAAALPADCKDLKSP